MTVDENKSVGGKNLIFLATSKFRTALVSAQPPTFLFLIIINFISCEPYNTNDNKLHICSV
jgi:hypothetical protein